MSDQPNQEPTLTPQELRQYLLDQLATSKEAIQELNDEDLVEVAGGVGTLSWSMRVADVATLAGAIGGNTLLKKTSIRLGM